MCSRYSFISSKEQIEQQFNLEVPPNLRVHYNIVPTQHAYIITNENTERLQYITWGLIPHWSRDGQNEGKLINARKEGISSKPSFRIPIRQKRCLVLADSFYEWRREGQNKIPHRILLKTGDIMVMAGIWDVWYKGDYAVKSFSIITQVANQEMANVNSRMPVVLLNKTLQQAWLQDQPLNNVLNLLEEKAEDIFHIYPISDKINSANYNGMDLHNEALVPPYQP